MDDRGGPLPRRELLLAGGLLALGALTGCGGRSRLDDGAAPGGVAPPQGADPTTAPPLAPEGATPREGATGEAAPDERPDAPAPLEVICRDALGLAAARDTGSRHRIERLMLHHTGVELGANQHAPERLRLHQRAHLGHGWTDIAYHFAVDLRGNTYELRDPDLAGETFTDYGPAGHLLVVCEGNYDVEQPTDVMLGSVATMLAHAADRYGVSVDTLTGHRDHVPTTACPGDHLYDRLDDLRREATRLRAEGPRELVAVCGEQGRERVARIEAGA